MEDASQKVPSVVGLTRPNNESPVAESSNTVVEIIPIDFKANNLKSNQSKQKKNVRKMPLWHQVEPFATRFISQNIYIILSIL